MRQFKWYFLSFLILCILLLSIGCSKSQQKPNSEDDNETKPIPPVVEEIEEAIISIMKRTDLIPYYEKQISEKEKIKQKKIEIQILTGQKQQQESGKGEEDKGESSQEQDEKDKTEDLIDFKPAPITLNDILLSEVLKKEGNKEEDENENDVPDDIIEIWYEINNEIMDLHDKWNTLETEISEYNLSKESIAEFESTLNNLTISGSGMDYMNTLIYSNKLTSIIPDLISNFKNKYPNTIYNIKYSIRQIVLECGNNDYNKAQESLDKLKIYLESLTPQLVEKKLTEETGKLESSLKDLEDAIKLQDINVIKIKASIIMKNISSIKEELSKSS